MQMCNINHILYIYFNMQSRSEALHVTAKKPGAVRLRADC